MSQDSYDWADSLFESSWANFMLKQKGYSKALGNIHTIQAPYFENYIKPESVAEGLTVKATIYFYNCLYDRAAGGDRRVQRRSTRRLRGAEEADHRAPGQRRAVRRRGQDPQGDLRAARAGRARRARRPRRPEPGRALRVRRGARPRAQAYDKADASWKSTNIAQTVFADLTLQRSLAVNEAGDLARRRIKRLTEELAQLIKRVIKIEYEILQGQKGALEQEVDPGAGDQPERRRPHRRAEEIRVDDEHHDLAVHRRVLARRARLLPGEDRRTSARAARPRARRPRARRPRRGRRQRAAARPRRRRARAVAQRRRRVASVALPVAQDVPTFALQQSRSGEIMTSQYRFSRGIFARALVAARSCWLAPLGARREQQQHASRPTAARAKFTKQETEVKATQTNLTKPDAPPPPKKETGPTLTVDQFRRAEDRRDPEAGRRADQQDAAPHPGHRRTTIRRSRTSCSASASSTPRSSASTSTRRARSIRRSYDAAAEPARRRCSRQQKTYEQQEQKWLLEAVKAYIAATKFRKYERMDEVLF